MVDTFKFIVDSFMVLLNNEFYIFPLILFSITLLISFVKGTTKL